MGGQPAWKAGDTAVCVDDTPRPAWASFFLDPDYTEGLIRHGERYTVLAVHAAQPDDPTGEQGLDIGVGQADGGRWWGANRFRLTLLRPATRAPAFARRSAE